MELTLSEEPKSPTFAEIPFRDSLRRDIDAAGFVTPTPIQAECIPLALAGRDVIGLAQTGTGKTAAFALPIIQQLAGASDMGALVLAPTRELAVQIHGVFAQLGKSSHVGAAVVVGGIPIEKDYKALRGWPNVLIATPGRLIDHITFRSVMLESIKVLVIDEADRMHDMGFIPQIQRILAALPENRQTMLFSATMPADVEAIARRNMRDPVRIVIGRRSAPAERAEQRLLHVSPEKKTELLIELLRKTDGRVLVFCRTKRGVDKLARQLRSIHGVGRIHGDRSQEDRDKAMGGFREGTSRVLIATDVAARGIDVADVEHVINYDFPQSPEDYVHRIGRTARVEASGQATTFVTSADRRSLGDLERHLGKKLTLTTHTGEPVPEHAEEPSRGHGRGHASKSGSSSKPGGQRRGRRGGRGGRGGRGRSSGSGSSGGSKPSTGPISP